MDIWIGMIQAKRDKPLDQIEIQKGCYLKQSSILPIIREVEFGDGDSFDVFQHPCSRHGEDL